MNKTLSIFLVSFFLFSKMKERRAHFFDLLPRFNCRKGGRYEGGRRKGGVAVVRSYMGKIE